MGLADFFLFYSLGSSSRYERDRRKGSEDGKSILKERHQLVVFSILDVFISAALCRTFVLVGHSAVVWKC